MQSKSKSGCWDVAIEVKVVAIIIEVVAMLVTRVLLGKSFCCCGGCQIAIEEKQKQ